MNFYPSSHNKIKIENSTRHDRVWSEWVDLPNPLVNNWHVLLKNVSYSKGTLHIHLPPGSTKTVKDLKSLYKLQIVNTPLDMTSCTTVESRTVTHVFPGWLKNSFANNLGHFIINILNPMFIYLFFVHNKLPNLANQSLVPNNQLPLSNTLLLIKADVVMTKPPVFLFDVVLRFASSYMQHSDYFNDLQNGGIHCFDSIDVPIYDNIEFLHPERNEPILRYGIWDSMHFTHKGRWGNYDFYYNFWRNVKHQIWQLYDMMPGNSTTIPLLHHTRIEHQRISAKSKPKLSFAGRVGDGPRSDGNLHEISAVFQKNFDVTIVGGAHYVWHEWNETMRFQRARRTLMLIQGSDILIGQSGSNNQLALFMMEGKIIVEIKNYNPCSNEAGKALANHNRLAFHAVRVLDVGLVPKNSRVMYTRAGLEKLSTELLLAWHANEEGFEHESRLDTWPSTCDFMWPHLDPKITAEVNVMTRSNVSRCYLEQVPGMGWYQLAKHKNSLAGDCHKDSVPYGVSLIYCMVHGVC